MPAVDLTQAREALAEWEAMSDEDKEGGADFPDVDFLRAALAEVDRLTARLTPLETEIAALCDPDARYRTMLDWRGVQTPCPTCGGSGRRGYGNTSTWQGGAGGCAMTNDVCDACWGSGDVDHPGADLRALLAHEASQHKARARDVAAIASHVRSFKVDASATRAPWKLLFRLIADAIERGDWRDGTLPADPRDARIAALESAARAVLSLTGDETMKEGDAVMDALEDVVDADSPTLRLDPNPCHRYRWPASSRCPTYSGAHVCEYPGGHDGACRCGHCERMGRGKDIADPLPVAGGAT